MNKIELLKYKRKKDSFKNTDCFYFINLTTVLNS